MVSPQLGAELSACVQSLRRYALVLTRQREDAEDLVQECLTRAIAAADSFQPGTDLRVWLFRILHNAHVSNLRKRAVRQQETSPQDEPTAPADQHLRLELKETLDALEHLPEEQRQPIVLVALEDMSYSDGAKALGVPLGTFMSRLSRGRKALRDIVDGLRTKRIKSVK